MIGRYHRPETLQSALNYVEKKSSHSTVGAEHISSLPGEPIAVVDLGKLDLGKLSGPEIDCA